MGHLLMPDRHSLVTYQSSAWQHARNLAWVLNALDRGDKVLHRAVEPGELMAELGDAGESARRTGQLEILDAHQAFVDTAGRHQALRALHEELVRKAFDDGYPNVGLSSDRTATSVIAPEPDERLAHEHDLDRLTMDASVRILCCYDLRVERTDVLESLAGLHFRCADDLLWSTRLSGDRLLVRGEIDAGNAGRFGAALRAAVEHGVRTIDLGEVTVLSAAALQVVDEAEQFVRPGGDPLRLVNAAPPVRRVISTLRHDDVGLIELIAGSGPVTVTDDVTDPGGDKRLHAVARGLTELTAALFDAPSLLTVLRRIIEVALNLVPGADLASVTLHASDGTFHTPVRTNEVAQELDRLQYTYREGPCLDAAREPGPAVAVSEDLAVEPAWPGFGPAAAEFGMRSVVSSALLHAPKARHLSGALNLYSHNAGGISQADIDIALILASHASLAIASAEADNLQQLEVAQLRKAIDSRDVIGQAKGILMQRRGISADEAFDLLRDLSQRLNVRVAELAETLATRRDEIDVGESNEGDPSAV